MESDGGSLIRTTTNDDDAVSSKAPSLVLCVPIVDETAIVSSNLPQSRRELVR